MTSGSSTTAQLIKLGFELDNQSIQKIDTRISKLERTLTKFQAEVRAGGKVSDAAAKALDDFGDSSKDAARETDKLTKSMGKQEKQAKDLNKQLERADKFNSEVRNRAGAIGDVDSSVQTFAGGLRTAGAGGAADAVSAVGELAAVTEGLAQFGGSLKALPTSLQATASALVGVNLGFAGTIAVLGPAVLALAALGFAVQSFSKQLQDQQRAISSVFDARSEVDRLILEGGTVVEAEAALAAARIDAEVATNRLADAQRALAASPLPDFLDKIILGLGKEIKENEAALEEAVITQDAYTQALDAGRFAANDAAAAEEKLAASRVQQIQAEANLQRKLSDLARNGSTEQLEARRAQIADEQKIIEAQIAQLRSVGGEGAEQAITQLTQQLDILGQEADALASDELRNLIATREREAEQAKELEKQLKELQKAEEKLSAARDKQRDDLDKLTSETAKAQQKIAEDAADEIADANKELGKNIATSQNKLQQDLRSVDEDAQKEEIDARRDSAKTIQKLRKDAAKAEEKILRDAEKSKQEAQRTLDAVAFKQAQEQEQEALEENERQLEEGVKEEREALKARLSDIKRSARDRKSELRKAQQEELRDLKRANQERIREIRESEQEQLADLRESDNEKRKTIREAFQKEQELYREHFNKLNQITAQGLGSSSGSSNTQSRAGAGPPRTQFRTVFDQRAFGGPVSAGELYRVNEPRGGQPQVEFFRPNTGGQVISLGSGGGMGGGLNVDSLSILIQGSTNMNKTQIAAAVEEGLTDVIVRARQQIRGGPI